MRGTLIWGVLALLGTPAGAQDGSEGTVQRTPAGAVQFLSTVAKQVGIGLNVANGSTMASIGAAVTDVVAESDCVTRFEVAPGAYAVENADYGSTLGGRVDNPEDAAKVDGFLARHGLTRPPYRIEWSKTSDVVRTGRGCGYCGDEGTPKYVRVKGMTFSFPDARTAERAEFAMKFLIEKCGIPETNGF